VASPSAVVSGAARSISRAAGRRCSARRAWARGC